MSCIYKIKKGFSKYTNTEVRLANYVLDNVNEVLMDSAQSLGEKAGASAAAVIRFSKKVGYKGFTELKMDLAKDSFEESVEIDDILRAEDTLELLLKKIENYKISTINEAYKLINVNYLSKAIEAMTRARFIYIFGVGNSGIVAEDLADKLIRIDIKAIHHLDGHMQLTSSVAIGKEDVAIAISYRGSTREVNAAIKHAKEKGATTIGITQYDKNALSRLVDIPLHIPSEEKDIRYGAISSRDAFFIITDLLYLGVAKMDFAQTKHNILASRKLVKETFK